MRSHPNENGNEHQATYDEDGILIPDGVGGAGTADKASPESCLLGHLGEDANPYIWAAQLDGNPVEGDFVLFGLDFKLSKPLLHEYDNLEKYIKARPINPSNIILEPGCCINENKEIICDE